MIHSQITPMWTLTLNLVQTCMSFFILLNTKEDILKNAGNQN